MPCRYGSGVRIAMVAVRGWINRYTLCQMKRNKEMAKKTTETKTQQAITSVCGKMKPQTQGGEA